MCACPRSTFFLTRFFVTFFVDDTFLAISKLTFPYGFLSKEFLILGLALMMRITGYAVT